MDATQFCEELDTAGILYYGIDGCHLVKTYDESDPLAVLDSKLPSLLAFATRLAAWTWIAELVVSADDLLQFQQGQTQGRRLSWHARPTPAANDLDGHESIVYISLQEYVQLGAARNGTPT